MQTAAERLAGMTPAPPHHTHTQWTSANAARTLARWRELMPLGPVHKCGEDVVLFSQGDDTKSVHFVVHGIVKIVFSFADGSNKLLGLRYPGHLIGDWWLDLKMSSPFSAITTVPCEIHRVDMPQMREAEKRDRRIADLHREMLERDLCNLSATHLEMKGLAPTEILERLLWELAGVLGGIESRGTARLVLPLTNTEMADLCGLSESHYKEVRRELEDTGKLKHLARRLWVIHRRSS
jgi:CRP-like cAMP-binding protein